MYELIEFPYHNLFLIRHGIDGIYELVCRFEGYEMAREKKRILELAQDMRDVLNRDQVNRAGDIAHSFDRSDYSVPGEATAADDVCGDPACGCRSVKYAEDGTYIGGEENQVPDNWKPPSERAEEWPIDPQTGTPKVEPVGEVVDFPEPGVAHPVGCLCPECDPPIKDVAVEKDA